MNDVTNLIGEFFVKTSHSKSQTQKCTEIIFFGKDTSIFDTEVPLVRKSVFLVQSIIIDFLKKIMMIIFFFVTRWHIVHFSITKCR